MTDESARLSAIFNALGGKTVRAVALAIHRAARPLLWHEIKAACGDVAGATMTRLTAAGLVLADTDYPLPVPIARRPALYRLAPDVAAVLAAGLKALGME